MHIEVETLRTRYRERIAELLGAPPTGDFSLSAAASSTLLEILRRRRARRVLECGAGFSTLLLRTWAAETSVELLTLDHDSEWRDHIRALLKGEGLDYRGVIETCHIGKRRTAGPWDVILVDHGPTMKTRLDDLEALVATLGSKGAIVLDDFRRRTNYARLATAELKRLGLTVTVPPKSQSGDRALGVGYYRGA